jgi:ribosomal protein L24
MAVRTSVSMPTRVPDIRKGDTVIVLAGKDAGKRGTVDRIVRRTAAPCA